MMPSAKASPLASVWRTRPAARLPGREAVLANHEPAERRCEWLRHQLLAPAVLTRPFRGRTAHEFGDARERSLHSLLERALGQALGAFEPS